MSKRKKYKNASLNIRGNPQFGKRVEKPQKGKGSYKRKNKYKEYQKVLNVEFSDILYIKSNVK